MHQLHSQRPLLFRRRTDPQRSVLACSMAPAQIVPSSCPEVIKPALDKKLYRHFQLSSGLTVLLISDPDIKAGKQGGKKVDASAAAGKHDDEGSIEDMNEDSSEDIGESEEGADITDEGEDSGSAGEEQEGEDGATDGDESGAKRKGGAPAAAVKKAAAAMAVGIGSLSDPAHMQGLSHYLEHMLFMGSAKFPDENEYDDFLTKHGGSSNAFTELEYTNFHFEVAPDALHDALERFAQFFIAPLCNAGSLEREVLAVDSEFAGVQQNDACRISQLMCHTARTGHPYRKFSWGNKKSLWDEPLAAGLDIRQHILDYYHQHYTAERMSLVLLGGEPLDTLQGWIQELFSDLPTGKGPRPSFASMPSPFQGRMLYMMPAVRDQHEVSITFQLPCMFPYYGCKAEQYVAHLVGHEGPGSLLSYLKAQGWATEVCAGVEEDGYSQNTGCFLFSITITLTDAGLSAGPGAGLAAVGAAFQYLNMLHTAGPQEWVWREMACISEMKFRFQEEEEALDMVSRLASSLHIHAPQHVLLAEYLHERWDPQLVQQVLDAMRPASSEYRVDLLTRSYPELKESLRSQLLSGAAITQETEPWFNMEASWAEIPNSLCTSWASTPPASELHLPPPNPYITTDFNVKGAPPKMTSKADAAVPDSVHIAEDQPQDVTNPSTAEDEAAAALSKELGLPLVLATPPHMVHDAPGLRVWHKLDRRFLVPRATVYFRVASPHWCDGPRTAALTHLALKLIEDVLTEDSYLADVAGLHYSTAPEGLTGVELKVDGFSHKLPLLAARLFGVLSDAATTFQTASFVTVKEALQRKYRNMCMQVSKHANYERLYALCKHGLHYTALQPHLDAAELHDVVQHVRTALTCCHVEVLCHGNMTQHEACDLAQATQAALGPGCIMSAAARTRDCCVQLPAGLAVQHTQVARNSEEENCCVEVYYQVGVPSSPAERAVLDLVDQLVYEPAYNTLRTQQQLGYTVHTGTRLTHGVLGFCVVVVSASHTPQDVDARIEEFLQTFSSKLSEMSEEELAQQKASLAANKLTRDRALADESVRHWDHVWNQRYDFMAREAEVEALQGITMEQVRTWWATYLAPASPSRRKLSIHVRPTKSCPAAAQGTTAISNGGHAAAAGDKGSQPVVVAALNDSQQVAASAAAAAATSVSPPTRSRAKKARVEVTQPQRAAQPAQAKVLVVDSLDDFKAGQAAYPVQQAADPPTSCIASV